jgi:hypothetical protein
MGSCWRKEGGFGLKLERLVTAIIPALSFHRASGFKHMHIAHLSRYETAQISLSDPSLLA